jgi:hypothetical protein
MTVRIHEADGTPYEHVLDIRNSQKKYEVLFNTKYKRVRRNTKRFLARKAAAAAAEAGDPEAAEALEMIDSGFELKLWEDESKRAWWMVSDWTDEDEALMNGASYEWIRLDADFEWISIIQFDQPDYMWVSQLQRDRDVVAQLEVSSTFPFVTRSDNSMLLGIERPRSTTNRNCFEQSYEDGAGHKLFLSNTCGSRSNAHICGDYTLYSYSYLRCWLTFHASLVCETFTERHRLGASIQAF